MARKSGRIGRQKKRVSAETKESLDQTQPAKSSGERESRDGRGEVPEWINRSFEEARDLMDQALVRMSKEGKLQKKRK